MTETDLINNTEYYLKHDSIILRGDAVRFDVPTAYKGEYGTGYIVYKRHPTKNWLAYKEYWIKGD